MKILIVNRFFGGAQIPTGRMAEDVARVLVERGHEVTALASSGEYVGAAAQARDYRATGRQDDPPMRSPLQPAPAGQRRLSIETVNVQKWMPRALAWLWFTWQARKRVPRMDWDVCVLMTDPPLLPLIAKRAKARGQDTGNRGQSEGSAYARSDSGVTAKRRLAVWLMDLYPEALAASGRITKSNPLYRWYFNKRQAALAASDLLVFLGETQKALVEKYEGEKVGGWEGGNREQGTGDGEQVAGKTERPNYRPTRIAVVPPWDDRGNIALATDESLRNLALYAGNLGEAHCFEEILAAAPYLPADWTIRFAARGAKLAALKEKAGQSGHGLTRMKVRICPPGYADRTVDNAHAGGLPALAVSPPSEETKTQEIGDGKRVAAVEITGYASEEETPGLLASARVHLITMSPGWEGIVVPSKLYGCIRTGRPVLFIGPEDADTAREIRANDWGKVLPSGASGEEVAAAILELAARPTRAVQLKQGAAEVAGELIRLAEGDG